MIKTAELSELKWAVGTWPWRTQWIETSSAKPISETMTLLLALVMFEDYDLFPARRNERT